MYKKLARTSLFSKIFFGFSVWLTKLFSNMEMILDFTTTLIFILKKISLSFRQKTGFFNRSHCLNAERPSFSVKFKCIWTLHAQKVQTAKIVPEGVGVTRLLHVTNVSPPKLSTVRGGRINFTIRKYSWHRIIIYSWQRNKIELKIMGWQVCYVTNRVFYKYINCTNLSPLRL